MSRSFSTADVLDEAADTAASIAAPWAGVAWLLVLPLRWAEAELLVAATALGAEAASHGDHLRDLAALAVLGLVCASLGRAWFVRAVSLALRGGEPDLRDVLRPGLSALLSQLYVALCFEVAAWVLAPTALGAVVAILLGGLAAALAGNQERPSLAAPFRDIARYTRPLLPVLAVGTCFALAWLAAMVNLGFLFDSGLWLARSLPGLELSAWESLLSFSNPRLRVMLALGAWLALEPAWLAAWVVYVQRVRSTETGEDLRMWLTRLRRREAAA